MAKCRGGDEMEGCTDDLTALNMKMVRSNMRMSSVIRNPHRPGSLDSGISCYVEYFAAIFRTFTWPISLIAKARRKFFFVLNKITEAL